MTAIFSEVMRASPERIAFRISATLEVQERAARLRRARQSPAKPPIPLVIMSIHARRKALDPRTLAAQ